MTSIKTKGLEVLFHSFANCTVRGDLSESPHVILLAPKSSPWFRWQVGEVFDYLGETIARVIERVDKIDNPADAILVLEIE